MLDYKTLNSKPIIKKTDSEGRIIPSKDLLARTWRTDMDPFLVRPIVVNEYYVARPDLISLAVYGSDEFGDFICKWNGISNPFELNEGMLISIPPMEFIREMLRNKETYPCKLIDNSKKETIQKQRNNSQRKKTDARSSSQSTIGDKPAFVIDKTLGLVIY